MWWIEARTRVGLRAGFFAAQDAGDNGTAGASACIRAMHVGTRHEITGTEDAAEVLVFRITFRFAMQVTPRRVSAAGSMDRSSRLDAPSGDRSGQRVST
jgi:hypothetical protein